MGGLALFRPEIARSLRWVYDKFWQLWQFRRFWQLLYPFSVIIGTGVDITEVPRIQRALERYGDRFLKRVFTSAEISYCTGKTNVAERLAARFAAKEAGMKAIGTGLRGGITWQDVEVVRLPGQRPQLLYHGRAAEVAAALGCKRTHLSLSHTAEQAIAHVILESQ